MDAIIWHVVDVNVNFVGYVEQKVELLILKIQCLLVLVKVPTQIKIVPRLREDVRIIKKN